MTLQQVLDLINAEIVANGNNEITANVLRPILEAMVNQPNDLIGDLGDLNTTATDNLVNAINEVLSTIGNIQILTGATDPNVTPPVTFNIGDFYIWNDGGLQGFYQFNGATWVQIGGSTNNIYKVVDVGTVTTAGQYTTPAELLSAINTATFTVGPNEIILIRGVIKFKGVNTVADYHFLKSHVEGDWGTGQTNGDVVFNDIRTNFIYFDFDQLLNEGTTIALGDIGSDTFHDYINANAEPVLDDWNLDGTTLYFFSFTSNGVDYVVLYEGQQPAHLGTTGDYVVLSTDYSIISVNGDETPTPRWNDLVVELVDSGAVVGGADVGKVKVYYNGGTDAIENLVFNSGFAKYLDSYKSLLDGKEYDVWVHFHNLYNEHTFIARVTAIANIGVGEYQVTLTGDSTILDRNELLFNDLINFNFFAKELKQPRFIDGYQVDTTGNIDLNAIEVGNTIIGIRSAGRFVIAEVTGLPYTNDANIKAYVDSELL